MAKLLKALLALIALYLVVMGGSGLLIRSMLSGGVGESLRKKAEALLPVDVSIEGGDFDIPEWFAFRPAISFDRLRIANPPGFSDEPLLMAQRVAARAKLADLFGGLATIDSIEIDAPHLRVESDKDGRTNIQALLDALKSPAANDAPPAAADENARSILVQSFVLRNGEVRYVSPGEEPLVARNLEIAIRNFDPGGAFPLTAQLDLFEEGALHLAFDGETGPFTPKSSPAAGKLTLESQPGKLPAAFRRQYLGDFLAAPGNAAKANLTTDVKGDLLGALVATGNLRIDDFQLGDPGVGQLPLSGEAPVMLTLIDPAANPSYDFVMPEAQLQLGAGSWKGGLQVQYDGNRVRGESSGAVSGVDINQMLSAFTEADDLLFGQLALRRYSVRFSGRDAVEIQRSLTGGGELEIDQGKLALFDALRTIEQKVMRVIGSEESYVAGVTSFVRLTTDFRVGEGRLTTPNLMLENDQAQLGAAGFVEFASETIGLDYSVSSLITGALAAALGGEKNAQGEAQVAAPLRVSGTTESPKVFLDLKIFVKQQAASQAKRLIDSLLKGRLGGESEAAPAGEQPAAPSPEPSAPQPEEDRPRLPFSLGGILDQAIKTAKDKIPSGAPAEPKAPQP